MSVRDINNYYNEVCDTYHELICDLKELEKEANEGMLSPEKFEKYKETIEPIKINYQRLSYIMYLLNAPNRKSKVNKYNKQHKKELDFFDKNNLVRRDVTESKEILNSLR